MAVEFHEIGTPREEEGGQVCATNDGRVFIHQSGGKSEWTGSLFESILSGDLHLLVQLKDQGVFDTAKAPDTGFSLLHYAAAAGQEEIASLLLKTMHRPHEPDWMQGSRPLAIACRYGWSSIVRKLIASGAIVPAVDRRGNTCMHEAARYAQYKCLSIVLEIITAERLAPMLCHVLWMKNLESQTCYDVAVAEGHIDAADLIMSYMRRTINH